MTLQLLLNFPLLEGGFLKLEEAFNQAIGSAITVCTISPSYFAEQPRINGSARRGSGVDHGWSKLTPCQ
jgi:hypothetical protein